MNRFRILTPIVLAVALGVSACGGSTGETASAGHSAGGVGPSTAAASLDACSTLDPATIADLVQISVEEGAEGASIGESSRCEFLSTDDGIDVAVQLGSKADGPPGADSSFLTREGFEQIFGPSTEVPGLQRPAFGILDDSVSVGQVAVDATDGETYALVTLTGFGLTEADIDRATLLVDEVEGAA